jgi:type III secretion system FlhB-like substrate exporter
MIMKSKPAGIINKEVLIPDSCSIICVHKKQYCVLMLKEKDDDLKPALILKGTAEDEASFKSWSELIIEADKKRIPIIKSKEAVQAVFKLEAGSEIPSDVWPVIAKLFASAHGEACMINKSGLRRKFSCDTLSPGLMNDLKTIGSDHHNGITIEVGPAIAKRLHSKKYFYQIRKRLKNIYNEFSDRWGYAPGLTRIRDNQNIADYQIVFIKIGITFYEIEIPDEHCLVCDFSEENRITAFAEKYNLVERTEPIGPCPAAVAPFTVASQYFQEANDISLLDIPTLIGGIVGHYLEKLEPIHLPWQVFEDLHTKIECLSPGIYSELRLEGYRRIDIFRFMNTLIKNGISIKDPLDIYTTLLQSDDEKEAFFNIYTERLRDMLLHLSPGVKVLEIDEESASNLSVALSSEDMEKTDSVTESIRHQAVQILNEYSLSDTEVIVTCYEYRVLKHYFGHISIFVGSEKIRLRFVFPQHLSGISVQKIGFISILGA